MMGLLLDPTNEDVISILSRLFPGKSVGDVLSSRAAEAAKHAIKNIFAPARQPGIEDEETQSIFRYCILKYVKRYLRILHIFERLILEEIFQSKFWEAISSLEI